ncbi:M16 family metallopeptidase [Fodinicola acaciae]|uniref:M16 family metallopeptidase n=1 Tax=Fodinicola acaciae TaxID=2681555 RepID=UPI001C9E9FE8|nr:pitrilysin family protein [Fodinicola acaciae]
MTTPETTQVDNEVENVVEQPAQITAEPAAVAEPVTESPAEAPPVPAVTEPGPEPVAESEPVVRSYPTTLPDLAPPRKAKRPAVSERVLDNGLRVIAVRRPGVPLVEVRLRIPFAGTGKTFLPRSAVLAETLLSGTSTRSSVEIAADLQSVGGGLSVSTDPDRLMVAGNALASGLPKLLELLGGVLTDAAYPTKEVSAERDRLGDRLEMANSQPAQVARKAMQRRFFGNHPYAVQVPEPDEVRGITPAALRRLHDTRVVPDGSTLVIVGDTAPGRALDAAQKALSDWTGGSSGSPVKAVRPPELGPVLVVDRPGSVQSSLRLSLLAVSRAHEDYPALQLANLTFGGYFSSRLVENIREDKGYTYSPHATLSHSVAGSIVSVDADVATEVTAPALLEVFYELGRISAVPITTEELEQARQYAVGTQALSVASQSGLASTISALAGVGLDLDWFYQHAANLRSATLEQVRAAALEYLRPSEAVTVVVGEAERIVEPLSAITDVEEYEEDEEG